MARPLLLWGAMIASPTLLSRSFAGAASALLIAALAHCGGSVTGTGGDGGVGVPPGGDGGVVPTMCHGDGSTALPGDRPQAVTCPATTFGQPVTSVPCTTLADCQDAGGYYQACRASQCSADACLTDSDCPTGEACGCSSDFGGNAIHTNTCIPAQCRIDSDCGPGGICSPYRSDFCNSLSGYYCHSAADECTTNANCCDPDKPSCKYQPTLGHFACEAVTACNG